MKRDGAAEHCGLDTDRTVRPKRPFPLLRPAISVRSPFEDIIRRASVEPWPRRWQHPRATRQTELPEEFAARVVNARPGNSPRVAERNDLDVTEDHLERSALASDGSTTVDLRDAAQNTAQQRAAPGRTD